MYKLYYISKTSLDSLEAVIEDPKLLTADVINRLMSLESVLPDTGNLVASKCKELIILAIVYSSFYAVASAFSLVSVYALRKRESISSISGDPVTEMCVVSSSLFLIDARERRPYLHGSLPTSSISAATSQSTATSGTYAVSAGSQRVSAGAPRAGKKILSTQEKQQATLERLVADLTLSVPVVLVLTCYYPVRALSLA